MSRSCLALLVLLCSLVGPLLVTREARSESGSTSEIVPACPPEAYAGVAVCTPPTTAVHPADEVGLVPYPAAAQPEDWRDFVSEPELTNQYDDLFATLPENKYSDLFATLHDVARQTIKAFEPVVKEADRKAYSPASKAAPEYDPYADSVVAQSVPGGGYQNIEAYEAEFSGYGTTDYLRDNFDYLPHDPFQKRSVDLAKVFPLVRVIERWGHAALESELACRAVNYGHETYVAAQQVAAEHSFASLVEASELAWDRLEEHNRLTLAPLPTESAESFEIAEQGFRLPGDDCGWECLYGLHGGGPAPEYADATDTPPPMDRQALLTAASSLKALADQIDAAANWLIQVGNIDVAELESGRAAR